MILCSCTVELDKTHSFVDKMDAHGLRLLLRTDRASHASSRPPASTTPSACPAPSHDARSCSSHRLASQRMSCLRIRSSSPSLSPDQQSHSPRTTLGQLKNDLPKSVGPRPCTSLPWTVRQLGRHDGLIGGEKILTSVLP